MYVSPHFTIKEMECPTTKKIAFQDGFVTALEDLREAYGKPMAVTSACRSSQHNRWLIERGYQASFNSFHLMQNQKYKTDTCAIDIARPTATDFHNLLRLALQMGWTVGIAKNFLHLDLRAKYTDLPRIIYLY